MKDLIPIRKNEDGIRTVNARDLHRFIESKRDFPTWYKDRVERYGFVDGEDFTTISGKSTGGRPSIEYHVSLDMAKELAMIENNENGRKARRYFIQKEQEANNIAKAIKDVEVKVLKKVSGEIIPQIQNEMKLLASDIIKSELNGLEVKKADETVQSMSYDRIAHQEIVWIRRAMKERSKSHDLYDPEKYKQLRKAILERFVVTAYVRILKRDFKEVMLFINRYDFGNQQISLF